MNDLQTYKNNQFGEIRVIAKDGKLWFVAVDVCNALDISNSRDAIARLDNDEKGVVSTDTLGGMQRVQIINEAGLYTLILGSRKKEAKDFKRWITHEVIPSIMQHGAYMTPETIEKTLTDPDFIIGLANQLKKAQEANRALAQKVLEDKPKVEVYDMFEASNDLISIGDCAKVAKQNGIDIGRDRLFKWLRDNGWLGKRGDSYNKPTQKAMIAGYFKLIERVVFAGTINRIVYTPKLTPKGQAFFLRKLANA